MSGVAHNQLIVLFEGELRHAAKTLKALHDAKTPEESKAAIQPMLMAFDTALWHLMGANENDCVVLTRMVRPQEIVKSVKKKDSSAEA